MSPTSTSRIDQRIAVAARITDLVRQQAWLLGDLELPEAVVEQLRDQLTVPLVLGDQDAIEHVSLVGLGLLRAVELAKQSEHRRDEAVSVLGPLVRRLNAELRRLQEADARSALSWTALPMTRSPARQHRAYRRRECGR